MTLSSVGIESFAVINEVGAQISPSEKLHKLLEQIVRSEVRKLAISLMFPYWKNIICQSNLSRCRCNLGNFDLEILTGITLELDFLVGRVKNIEYGKVSRMRKRNFQPTNGIPHWTDT
jgi:hypothetical protein